MYAVKKYSKNEMNDLLYPIGDFTRMLSLSTLVLCQLSTIRKHLTLTIAGRRYTPSAQDLRHIDNARAIHFINDLDCNTAWFDGQTFYRTRFGDGRYQPVNVSAALADFRTAGVYINNL